MTSTLARALWRISGFAILAALPLFANAQMIFERTQVHIESPPPNEKDKNPKPPHVSLVYDIELRKEDALKLEYIHTLNNLTEDTGVMIVLDSPAILPVPALRDYTPIDVVFIAEDGTVVQITPNLKLGELAQDVHAKQPVKALLFLKAGQAAERGMHPRDMVIGTMFTQPPPTVD
jgi:hypothetical protein